MQQALSHHEAGRLDQAERIYKQILSVRPDDCQALLYSGLLMHQRGQSVQAIAQMRRAIALDGGKGAYFQNLAAVLEETGDMAGAADNYRRAAALDPQQHEAHVKAGICLLSLNRATEAAVCFTAALAAKPNYPHAINCLGLALQKMGRLEQAAVCFRKAIALNPNYAEAHANLGLPLRELGRLDEALACFDEAIRIDPKCYPAWGNRCLILGSQGKLEEAVQSCEQAIAINPKHPGAHLNLGNSLRELGYLSRAIGPYRRAIALDPGYGPAYSNLGETLRDMGRIAEAAENYEKALQAQPDFLWAFSNLLYLHSFTRDISPEDELALARKWEQHALTAEERAAARRRASPRAGVFSATPRAGRKLHLGVVSAELGTHAVAEFLQPFLENVGKQRFRLTLFPTTVRKGERAEHLAAQADAVIPLVGAPGAEAAARIRAQAVDVLMDTTGHTTGSRLDIFAHRAAPVQLSYIGYWSTTGLTEMDWVFADPLVPAENSGHFSEKLWKLPRVVECYRGDPLLPESRWRPGDTVWLGSFNRYSKMREETFALWAQVMTALPESKLLLEDRASNEEETHLRILAGMAAHGVSAHRIEFVPAIFEHERHMALYDRLDIALDTLPFNSGTTAYDALWMGVPLVALEASHTGGRISTIALRDIGRTEWIANSEEEYVAKVCALAHDVELRKLLRKTQRAQMAASPACDSRALAGDIQTAMEQMYDMWLASDGR